MPRYNNLTHWQHDNFVKFLTMFQVSSTDGMIMGFNVCVQSVFDLWLPFFSLLLRELRVSVVNFTLSC